MNILISSLVSGMNDWLDWVTLVVLALSAVLNSLHIKKVL